MKKPMPLAKRRQSRFIGRPPASRPWHALPASLDPTVGFARGERDRLKGRITSFVAGSKPGSTVKRTASALRHPHGGLRARRRRCSSRMSRGRPQTFRVVDAEDDALELGQKRCGFDERRRDAGFPAPIALTWPWKPVRIVKSPPTALWTDRGEGRGRGRPGRACRQRSPAVSARSPKRETKRTASFVGVQHFRPRHEGLQHREGRAAQGGKAPPVAGLQEFGRTLSSGRRRARGTPPIETGKAEVVVMLGRTLTSRRSAGCRSRGCSSTSARCGGCRARSDRRPSSPGGRCGLRRGRGSSRSRRRFLRSYFTSTMSSCFWRADPHPGTRGA